MPAVLQPTAARAWRNKWVTLLSPTVQKALAATLVDTGVDVWLSSSFAEELGNGGGGNGRLSGLTQSGLSGRVDGSTDGRVVPQLAVASARPAPADLAPASSAASACATLASPWAPARPAASCSSVVPASPVESPPQLRALSSAAAAPSPPRSPRSHFGSSHFGSRLRFESAPFARALQGLRLRRSPPVSASSSVRSGHLTSFSVAGTFWLNSSAPQQCRRMPGWQQVQSRRTKNQLKQLASVLGPLLQPQQRNQRQQPRTRKPE